MNRCVLKRIVESFSNEISTPLCMKFVNGQLSREEKIVSFILTFSGMTDYCEIMSDHDKFINHEAFFQILRRFVCETNHDISYRHLLWTCECAKIDYFEKHPNKKTERKRIEKVLSDPSYLQ